MGILQLQALHSENQGNGEEICQASSQQMAQGLVVFPPFDLDFLILFFLPSIPFHPFVEVDNGRIKTEQSESVGDNLNRKIDWSYNKLFVTISCVCSFKCIEIMFGYLYYWFACHYYKKLYKVDYPFHFPAAVALGAIQFLLVYNAYMIYSIFFPLELNVAYKTPVTVAVLAVVAVVCWFNYRFYGGKIEVLSKKYKSCALNNKLKGWMMFLFMFGLFFFPALVSFVFHLFF